MFSCPWNAWLPLADARWLTTKINVDSLKVSNNKLLYKRAAQRRTIPVVLFQAAIFSGIERAAMLLLPIFPREHHRTWIYFYSGDVCKSIPVIRNVIKAKGSLATSLASFSALGWLMRVSLLSTNPKTANQRSQNALPRAPWGRQDFLRFFGVFKLAAFKIVLDRINGAFLETADSAWVESWLLI